MVEIRASVSPGTGLAEALLDYIALYYEIDDQPCNE